MAATEDAKALDPAAIMAAWRDKCKKNLFESVLRFWCTHSPDSVHGGSYNCLDVDGKVFDTTKYVWLLGRQVWMFSRIANSCSEEDIATSGFTKAQLLEQANSTLQFLRKHAVRRDDRQVFFALAEDGQPALFQRKIFSAVFLCLALNEYGLATGDRALREEAVAWVATIWSWIQDPTALGRPQLSGAAGFSPLNVPMMLLHTCSELTKDSTAAEDPFAAQKAWSLAEIKKHIVPSKKAMFENVKSDGSLVTTLSEGRLLNPGHAIEAAWFLLEHAERHGDAELTTAALQVLDWSFEAGWDKTHGGILYFIDSEGFTPTQLEWDMKLWWPHCEAMIAFAYAYKVTKSADYLTKFQQVAEYTFAHFPDAAHGEWFGYLNRAGEVTHRFKGGPYKGCFHVPRALLYCVELLG